MKQVVQKITLKLHKEPKLSVDRVKVAGSFGKMTALPGSDVDLVIFLNNEKPPFTKVLELLKHSLSSLSTYEFLKETRYSIQFALNRLKFDLLPAINFGKPGKAQLQKSLAALQLSDDIRSLSTSLSEFSVYPT